jgi:MscS family membrane protein
VNTTPVAEEKTPAVRSLRDSIARAFLLPLAGVLILLLASILYDLHLKRLLTERMNTYLTRAFFTLLVMTGAAALQRFVSAALRWYALNVATKTETKFDDEFLPLLRKVVNILIWVIVLLMILTNFGVNVAAIVATLGVTSLAIALAAQDTIANVIAGFLIMIDRPFRVGDEIKLPSGERVRALDIGVRRSRFLNLDDGSIVIVPNLDLSRSKVINYTYGKELPKEAPRA